ncbi:serine/threonine-protein kinase [Sandaracinus amylolyticus]|uniref:non-specific serine/threonine protein kinase n=1 Tax=Sandaracinus amylolyticus TaxID=927083 RepID=A0A0F6YHY3_9BACT|nr:serine/threonine-protein kinase [Sandaracinus amylolyticus]AKF06360.1 Serine/threonine protein kinase PrkC, regulator of stationary phase [Sandaracinus amylolyticus]
MEPGTRIGKYVIEARLGEGGNGTVYAARDGVLGRHVAFKVLHPHLVSDAQIAARFRQEAQAMAQLNHPNVVIVHDFVGEANRWAIVMELAVNGETLGSLIKRAGRLDPARAARLCTQVAAGLGHAHARGIVHRDVKPANVLVLRDGGSEVAKITDFGIARVANGERRTQAQLTLGTLWYIAPEQAQNSSVDARADVYSLGATLYEALTGSVPFPYDNAARVLAAHISEMPRPPSTRAPGIPEVLDELVLRCLSKNPDERPRDGDQLAALLGAITQRAAAIPSTQVASAPAIPQPAPVPPAADVAPPGPAAPASRLTREDSQVGMWIGIGGLVLLSSVCLLGSFLCVLTGFLR